jgi:hypothetical protein
VVDGIKKRAKSEIHGNLKLGVLSNEDDFLLKGVTLKEGYIEIWPSLPKI